jgi:hypothetical protein
MWQLSDSSSFSNLKNSKYMHETVGNHGSVAVARQLVVQQSEEQQVHKTVGNHNNVAVVRQRVLRQPKIEQQNKTVGNHDSEEVARQRVLQQPKIEQQNQTVSNLDTASFWNLKWSNKIKLWAIVTAWNLPDSASFCNLKNRATKSNCGQSRQRGSCQTVHPSTSWRTGKLTLWATMNMSQLPDSSLKNLQYTATTWKFRKS